MHLQPFNKHLLVLPQEQQQDKENPLFVMPDEYQPPKSPYMVCDIIGMSDDCTIDLNLGDTIVVERTTVQEIQVETEIFYVVKENYVYGRAEQ